MYFSDIKAQGRVCVCLNATFTFPIYLVQPLRMLSMHEERISEWEKLGPASSFSM